MRGRLGRYLISLGGIGRRGSRSAIEQCFKPWERGFRTHIGEQPQQLVGIREQRNLISEARVGTVSVTLGNGHRARERRQASSRTSSETDDRS